MTTNMEIILYYACGSPVITPALKSWEFPLVKMSQKRMCEMWTAVRIQGFTVGLMTDEWNHYVKGNRGLSSTTANIEDMPACESTKCSRWPNKRANPSRNGNGESEMGHGTWRVRPRRIWPQPAWGWRCSSAHPSLQKKKFSPYPNFHNVPQSALTLHNLPTATSPAPVHRKRQAGTSMTLTQGLKTQNLKTRPWGKGNARTTPPVNRGVKRIINEKSTWRREKRKLRRGEYKNNRVCLPAEESPRLRGACSRSQKPPRPRSRRRSFAPGGAQG